MSDADAAPEGAGLLQTEFEFTLPQGYVDEAGDRHREGTMRLATAADEIKPLRDPRVKANPSYLSVVLLSRVVTSLGGVGEVTPHTIENLYVADLAYLQSLYERINSRGADAVDAICPECGESFEVHLGNDPADEVPVAGSAEAEETPEPLGTDGGTSIEGTDPGNPERRDRPEG
jgi:phage FluMu protein gp41